MKGTGYDFASLSLWGEMVLNKPQSESRLTGPKAPDVSCCPEQHGSYSVHGSPAGKP